MPNSIEMTIYADETQEVVDSISGEKWFYTCAIYELEQKPILVDLVDRRYCKDRSGWEGYYWQNNEELHWTELGNRANKYKVADRWLNYIVDDCFKDKKFHFSILGINLSNLNREEFDSEQNFNSMYNRFFRSMIQYCVKKFFNQQVHIQNIFHERGPQQDHGLFDWHTIRKLNEDESINLNCDRVEFLSKSHHDDKRSNILQLCDVLLGVFKDLHLGVNIETYPDGKKNIMNHKFVTDLLTERIIRNPRNINSSYAYAKRFNVSLFPKISTKPEDIERKSDSYYDVSKVRLSYEHRNQGILF